MKKRRVLCVQSHVVHGYVGNKASVFPLQLLGFDVDPINSVHFSNHTGYPRFVGQAMSGEQLWELIQGLDDNELLGARADEGASTDYGYSHLITGYIGSESFLDNVARVLARLRERNPELEYVCDPVMGDHGRFYTEGRERFGQIYKDKLIPLASLLTPNQFECEQLTGRTIGNLADACATLDALHALGAQRIVLTTLDVFGPSNVAMLLSTGTAALGGRKDLLKMPRIEVPYNFTGSGDLTAALLAARMYGADDAALPLALEQVGATLHSVLEDTASHSRGRVYNGRAKAVPPELRLIQGKNSIERPEVKYRSERVDWTGNGQATCSTDDSAAKKPRIE